VATGEVEHATVQAVRDAFAYSPVGAVIRIAVSAPWGFGFGLGSSDLASGSAYASSDLTSAAAYWLRPTLVAPRRPAQIPTVAWTTRTMS
jgi:hypothetical protein